MTILCSPATCKQELTDEDATVKIRIIAERKEQFPISCDDKRGGVVALHQNCWESLLSEHGRRRSKFAGRLRDAKETAEFSDARTVMEQEASRTAELLQTCEHAVVFTGAGISTSAGIGDFRGLFGMWTV
jgi:hypothetical protein